MHLLGASLLMLLFTLGALAIGTVYTPVSTGGKLASTSLTAALIAGASPSSFANDGQTMLFVRVGATPTTLNMVAPNCPHGRAFSNPLVLAINADYLLGPFPQAEFNDGNGAANFTLTSVTAVSIAVVRLASN